MHSPPVPSVHGAPPKPRCSLCAVQVEEVADSRYGLVLENVVPVHGVAPLTMREGHDAAGRHGGGGGGLLTTPAPRSAAYSTASRRGSPPRSRSGSPPRGILSVVSVAPEEVRGAARRSRAEEVRLMDDVHRSRMEEEAGGVQPTALLVDWDWD